MNDKRNPAFGRFSDNSGAAQDFTQKDGNTFGQRLELALSGESPHAFAKRAGIPDSTMRKYLADTMPGLEKLLVLAHTANVTLDWLAEGRGPMRPVEGDGVPAGFALIPRMDVHVAAGAGALVEVEDTREVLAFRADWLRRRNINPSTAHILTARGDSMEPTIRDGDILLVETAIDSVIDNAIYVVVFAGRTLVKRLQMLRNGDVVIKSDNKDVFDDETVPADEVPSINVAGRVMWYGRSI